MVIGAALVGAVLIGVLIWDWNRTPSTIIELVGMSGRSWHISEEPIGAGNVV